MKLYATTTSERASKGQGGNQFIDIDIYGQDKEYLITMRLKGGDRKPYELNYQVLSDKIQIGQVIGKTKSKQSFLQPIQDYEKEDLLSTEKGKQKKGEVCKHGVSKDIQCYSCFHNK